MEKDASLLSRLARVPAGVRPPIRSRGWLRWLRHLDPAERAKRQLDRLYQRRAHQRLRESGLSRA